MPATLITIPFSHFCEKARWSLDLAGVTYREEGHVPLAHRRPVRRAGGRRSVPVLVLEDGSALADSSLIVHFADAAAPHERKLFPTDAGERERALAFARHLDIHFAPHVRRFAYFHILPSRANTLRLFDQRTPGHERAFVRLLFPVLRVLMRRLMAIDEPHALASRDAIRRVFDDVGARIEGRSYLFGDRLGAADVTFAAFASPVLLPAEHPVTSGVAEHLEALAPPFSEEVDALRRTPAGAFALRLYREHRRALPVEG